MNVAFELFACESIVLTIKIKLLKYKCIWLHQTRVWDFYETLNKFQVLSSDYYGMKSTFKV